MKTFPSVHIAIDKLPDLGIGEVVEVIGTKLKVATNDFGEKIFKKITEHTGVPEQFSPDDGRKFIPSRNTLAASKSIG